MIPRFISNQLEQLSARYPIVAVTGPRQSGKTTLVRDTFPKKICLARRPGYTGICAYRPQGISFGLFGWRYTG